MNVTCTVLMQLPLKQMPHRHNEVGSYVLYLLHRYFIMEEQHCYIRDTLYLLGDESRVDVRSETFRTGISACHVECAPDGIAVWQ